MEAAEAQIRALVDAETAAWNARDTGAIALMSKGRQQRALAAAFERLLAEDLGNRVLDFDSSAAVEAASLAARRQRAVRPVDMRDTQIAGIAVARRATLATRNVRHFEDLKVPLVNPWQAGR